MARRRLKPWKPFVAPTRPPAGTYDPGLDAQQRAAQRGYGDAQMDFGTGTNRLTEDYALGVRDAQQSFDWGTGDLTRSRDRNLGDLATALQRGTEDYGTNTQNLQQSYFRLGTSQAEAAQQAGVAQGGSLRAALAARTENQGRDQSALDTSFGRFAQDNAQSVGRVNEDYGTGMGRAATVRDQQLGGLDLNRARQSGDLATGILRASRENTAFGQDVAAQRFFQAGQTGWDMPTKPGNEKRDAKGPYRLQTVGGRQVKVRPNGRIEPLGRPVLRSGATPARYGGFGWQSRNRRL